MRTVLIMAILGVFVMAGGATVAAEFERRLEKETLRKLTGAEHKTQTPCPDNTFLCYTSCCTNSQECCTTTKGCVVVGACVTPPPQSITQPEKLHR
jgi:hypothetical protein